MIMNSTAPAHEAAMRSHRGIAVPLKHTEYVGKLQGYVADFTVTQHYENTERKKIEAVYSFPLPSAATFLGLTMTIGDRKIEGVIKERSAASDTYEDAIDSGDKAALLEKTGDVYTISVGNVAKGEKVAISIRFAFTSAWYNDRLSLRIPTTFAPRYGDFRQAGLDELKVPEPELSAAHRCDFSLQVEGRLAKTTISSPSHKLKVTSGENSCSIMLDGKLWLDRDCVLVFESDKEQRSSCSLVRAKEGYIAMLSLFPGLKTELSSAGQCIQILQDCSGSMAGDSIEQSRNAIELILDQLRDSDYFNITCFGSDHESIFDEPKPVAARRNIALAKESVAQLDASMGGTEMLSALKAVWRQESPSGLGASVVMITDGEIHEATALIKQAKKTHCPHYVVGVGSAVNQSFLDELSDATGGMTEFVSPNEPIAPVIVRQFQRILEEKLTMTFQWPSDPEYVTVLNRPVHARDTLHIFAWFKDLPKGEVVASFSTADNKITQSFVLAEDAIVPSEELSVIARMAATDRVTGQPREVALSLALDYQLMTEYTSCVAVAESAEQEASTEIPVLRKVANMLAAGWGGTGSVKADRMMMSYSCVEDMPFRYRRKSPEEFSHEYKDDGVASHYALESRIDPADSWSDIWSIKMLIIEFSIVDAEAESLRKILAEYPEYVVAYWYMVWKVGKDKIPSGFPLPPDDWEDTFDLKKLTDFFKANCNW